MRQALSAVAVAVAAVLAVVGQARAFTFTVAVGDQIRIDSVLPSGVCGDYFGIEIEHDPLLGNTVTDEECFTGLEQVVASSEGAGSNCAYGGVRFDVSGTTAYACNGTPGATGSQGVQGPPGATWAYVDDDDDPIPGMYRLDGEAAYWDGYASWAYDATTGALQTPTVCAFAVAYYDESGCTGDPFLSFESRNLVRCARSGAGTQTYWRQTAGYTHGGSCWAWNGSTCASTGCPGASALVESAGSAPSLSGYATPWTVVVED